ncbi:MAG: RND transporter [Sedimenticola sp.]
MNWLDELPMPFVVVAAVLLGLAPFVPEPHVVEKLRMLAEGTLVKPVDIFDLFLHAAPIVVLVLKLMRMKQGS